MPVYVLHQHSSIGPWWAASLMYVTNFRGSTLLWTSGSKKLKSFERRKWRRAHHQGWRRYLRTWERPSGPMASSESTWHWIAALRIPGTERGRRQGFFNYVVGGGSRNSFFFCLFVSWPCSLVLPWMLIADRTYRPGKTEVVLKKVGQGVNLTAIEIFSPNAAHKPPGEQWFIFSGEETLDRPALF